MKQSASSAFHVWNFQGIFGAGGWWRSGQAAPGRATWACRLFHAEDSQCPMGPTRAFHLSLNCLKEFRLGAWSRKRTNPRDNYKEYGLRVVNCGGARQGLFVQTPLCTPLSLHGLVTICLPNACSSHFPVTCLPSLLKPQMPTRFSLGPDGT